MVKTSRHLRPSEAATKRFVAANTTIPVPRVYEKATKPAPSITMEYIEGQTLEDAWKGFSEEQKLGIVGQLSNILSQLRNLKGQYIGSLDHGKAYEVRQTVREGGPFDTEKEFNEFLLSNTYPSVSKVLVGFARRSLRRDQEIVSLMAILHPGILWSKMRE